MSSDESPTTCERCGRSFTNGSIMSMFNTQIICMKCKEKESRHPDYQEAREKESQAVRSGDTNFPGIGLPENLK